MLNCLVRSSIVSDADTNSSDLSWVIPRALISRLGHGYVKQQVILNSAQDILDDHEYHDNYDHHDGHKDEEL